MILRRDYRGLEVTGGFGRSSHGDAAERRRRDRSASATAGSTATTCSRASRTPTRTGEGPRALALAQRRLPRLRPDRLPLGLLPALYATTATFLQPSTPARRSASDQLPPVLYHPASDTSVHSRATRCSVTALAAASSCSVTRRSDVFGATLRRRQRDVPEPFIRSHPQPVSPRSRCGPGLPSFVVTPTTDRALSSSASARRLGRLGRRGRLASHRRRPVSSALGLGGCSMPAGVDHSFRRSGRRRPGADRAVARTSSLVPRRSTCARATSPASRLARLALGAEFRRERYPRSIHSLHRRDQRALRTSSSGHRTVASRYAELALPLASTLEASLARFDHYSDFGSTVIRARAEVEGVPHVAFAPPTRRRFARRSRPRRASPGRARARSVTCRVPDLESRLPALVRSSDPASARAVRSATGIVIEPWRDTSSPSMRLHRAAAGSICPGVPARHEPTIRAPRCTPTAPSISESSTPILGDPGLGHRQRARERRSPPRPRRRRQLDGCPTRSRDRSWAGYYSGRSRASPHLDRAWRTRSPKLHRRLPARPARPALPGDTVRSRRRHVRPLRGLTRPNLELGFVVNIGNVRRRSTSAWWGRVPRTTRPTTAPSDASSG